MSIKFRSYSTLPIIPASHKSRFFYTPSLLNLGLSHVNICRLLESFTVADHHHNLPSFDLYVSSQREYSEFIVFIVLYTSEAVHATIKSFSESRTIEGRY